MAEEKDLNTEVKFWLDTILAQENVENLTVNVQGTSEKGDGYIGDIVFVHASGTLENGSTKEYNLVLKCSKRGEVVQGNPMLRTAFVNETFFYKKLLPALVEFQKEKKVDKPFDAVPKCYGAYVDKKMHVIALDNLKESGYELWPREDPVTKEHIDLVMKAYAKFHATSVALEHQQPEKFQKILQTLTENVKNFGQSPMTEVFKSSINETAELLKDDLDEKILLKWRKLSDELENFFASLLDIQGQKVFLHGDCWNNNFMYKPTNGDKMKPSKVVILDWQVIRHGTPISDLSYFLFCCISKDDIEHLDDVLVKYHKYFCDHLEKMGISDSSKIYPFNQFSDDWRKYCKLGVVLSSLLLKICSTSKDNVVDVAESIESGKTFGDSFSREISLENKVNYKNRMRHIVEYAAKHNII